MIFDRNFNSYTYLSSADVNVKQLKLIQNFLKEQWNYQMQSIHICALNLQKHFKNIFRESKPFILTIALGSSCYSFDV